MSDDLLIRARHVMTPDPVCCLPTDTAQHAAAILRDRRIGAIAVVHDHESRKLMGVVTDRDLCCSVVASNLEGKGILVRQVLTKNPVTCNTEDALEDCIALIERYHVRRLPVVDGKGRIVGIVSLTDLARKVPPQSVSKALVEVSTTRSRRHSAA
ncbi:MAG TPA: CBS domain-containing protein [Candidatus Angelobacter sp.]|nr:CBS domain-containing protein [Candidatus Angelobacter sp.]